MTTVVDCLADEGPPKGLRSRSARIEQEVNGNEICSCFRYLPILSFSIGVRVYVCVVHLIVRLVVHDKDTIKGSWFCRAHYDVLVKDRHSVSLDLPLAVIVFGCHWSIVEDYRIARQINGAAAEVNNVNIQKERFIEELETLGTRYVPEKMAEFLREIQRKDDKTVANMRILTGEMELNVRKKDVFIKKLEGTVP
nr:hypothetical protein [Tanacetum cinerariifolium]